MNPGSAIGSAASSSASSAASSAASSSAASAAGNAGGNVGRSMPNAGGNNGQIPVGGKNGSMPGKGNNPMQGAATQAIGKIDGAGGKAMDKLGEKVDGAVPNYGGQTAQAKKNAGKEPTELDEAAASNPNQQGPGKKKIEDMTEDEKKNVANGGSEDSSTKKVLKGAGRAVAAYYTGGKSLDYDQAVTNSQTGGKLLGVVADTVDKVPGAKQLSEAADEAGVADGVNDALDLVAAAKKKDIEGVKSAAKNLKKDKKKLNKFQRKIFLKLILFTLLPVFILIILLFLICGPSEGGTLDLTGATGGVHQESCDGLDYEFNTESGAATIISQRLDTFLEGQGTSLDAFNEIIKSNIEEQGFGTRCGAVAAAATLVGELMDNYHAKVPYFWGGGHTGTVQPYAQGVWGSSSCSTYANDIHYDKCGLDCSGFVPWAIYTGGFDITPRLAGDYVNLSGAEKVDLDCSTQLLNPGDLLESSEHVTIIVAIDTENNKYITAEAAGYSDGVLFKSRSFCESGYWGVNLENFYMTKARSEASS